MSLVEEVFLDCPSCGETISVLVDCSMEEQSYIEDCQVCCQPMILNVHIDSEGLPSVFAMREDQ